MLYAFLNPFLLHPDGDPGGDGGTGEGSESQSQEDKDQKPPAGSDDTQVGAGDDQMVPAKEAQEARREAQRLRERTKKAEEELQRLKDKDLSDKEKVERERDELKSGQETLQEENRRLRVQVLLPQVGITDPDAVKLLDWSEIEDPSDEKQVLKALKKLVEAKPYLAGNVAGGADGGAGGGGRQVAGGDDMNARIRAASGRGRAS